MTAQPDQTQAIAGRIAISVDAMGGDAGAAAVVAGIALSAQVNPEIRFILHGPKETLEPLVAKLNSLGAMAPDGQSWTVSSFEAEMTRLGY